MALSAQPAHGGSFRHASLAGVGFAMLSLWPCLAADRNNSAPWAIRPAPAVLVTASMLVGAGWFVIALRDHGAAGVAERLLTTAQSFWPLIVAVSCLRHAEAERT